ncbi:hypothetical protein SCP_1600440 [Sparassis crispa]|uniref:Ubiquitin-like domain-containing protein n=1 Tax=Sparassis crispa TaxID=139825 RepID=A0A401H4Q5_9APHY|nr:hypothetical protein SCP_1600440 [Sparassis crispa]GBE89383.1 hypothetical protein SCP_1600440 [Sparassis crispa]
MANHFKAHPPEPKGSGTERRITVEVDYQEADGVRHLTLHDVPIPLSYETLCSGFEAKGLKPPEAILVLKEEYPLTVVDGPSTFERGVGGAVNINEPLLHYYNQCFLPTVSPTGCGTAGSAVAASSTPGYTANAHMLEIYGVDINFHRTVRVPDNNSMNLLPPSMGLFPIYNTAEYKDRLPASIASDSDIFITLYQREAMWISFDTGYSRTAAVKISVGGVNALTGLPMDAPSVGTQDYLAIKPEGGQSWIDGVSTAPGVVRQFVAMSLGKGLTVEGQITGTETVGGLQMEVFPTFPTTVDFHRNGDLDFYKTPRELGLVAGDTLTFTDRQQDEDETPRILGKTRSTMTVMAPMVRIVAYATYDFNAKLSVHIMPSDETVTMSFPSVNNVYAIKLALRESQMVAPSKQRLSYKGRALKDEDYISDYGIVPGCTIELEAETFGGLWRPRGKIRPAAQAASGLAAGGRITQKIVKDSLPASAYDRSRGVRVRVGILNSSYFAAATGLPPPETPISSATYNKLRLPWFVLYEENVPVADNLTVPNKLTEVKSVANLKASEGSGKVGGY